MVYNSSGQVKKSLYVFLCSILGVLLFLILHRLIVFGYLLLIAFGHTGLGADFSYLQFLAIEYVTLIVSLMLGAWYGVWIGLYWYQKVYEEKSYSGFVGHLAGKVWPKGGKTYHLKSKIEAISQNLEKEAWQVDDLGKSLPDTLIAIAPKPVKRRLARKRAAKK